MLESNWQGEFDEENEIHLSVSDVYCEVSVSMEAPQDPSRLLDTLNT